VPPLSTIALTVVGHGEVRDSRACGYVAGRFEREDRERDAYLTRELQKYGRCHVCRGKVQDREAPRGICSACSRDGSGRRAATIRENHQAQAARSAR
jgi:hypothetical protein